MPHIEPKVSSQAWSEAVEREPGLELEPLLLVTAVCGTPVPTAWQIGFRS